MARYLVLGDIHGDKRYLDILEAGRVFERLDGVLATGDIGGYGPDSFDCYRFLMNLKRKFEADGKIFKAVRGNHEDYLELKLQNPEIPLAGEGVSKPAEIGILLTIGQFFGEDVCRKVDGELALYGAKINSILKSDWQARLRSGNKDILNPGYSKKYTELPEVLSFIVNLPEEERIGRAKLMHSVRVKSGKERKLKYVMGEEQLKYMDAVSQHSKKRNFDRKRCLTPDQVFESGVFDDCDVLFLGHTHTSDVYRRDGKRIVMVNSPFRRDGGTGAPVLIYDGGLVCRKDLEYDFKETERKLREVNPKFLENQVELYRSVKREWQVKA